MADTTHARSVASSIVQVRVEDPGSLDIREFNRLLEDITTTLLVADILSSDSEPIRYVTRTDAYPSLTVIRARYGSPFVIDFETTMVIAAAVTGISVILERVSRIVRNFAEASKFRAEADALREKRNVPFSQIEAADKKYTDVVNARDAAVLDEIERLAPHLADLPGINAHQIKKLSVHIQGDVFINSEAEAARPSRDIAGAFARLAEKDASIAVDGDVLL